MKPEILVGMSGGVDSTVCCKLLQNEYRVRGIYCVMSDAHLAGMEAAEKAATELMAPLALPDLRERFERLVVLPFLEEYCAGRTPNPCVVCNPLVKFSALIRAADELGIHRIATGHYARVRKKNGFFVLQKAADQARDQSYMLYRLSQEALGRLILPLGVFTKQEVRRIAAENGYRSAGTPDSQEICFIPEGDYPGYIHRSGRQGKAGRLIAPDGTPLSPHKGVEYYTVGQRKGLGVSLGRPVFVRRILENGDILLGESGEEYAGRIVVDDGCINPSFDLATLENPTVKLRSMQQAVSCVVSDIKKDSFSLIFDTPQRAPAPGQSAVLYSGDDLVGGGIIRDFC